MTQNEAAAELAAQWWTDRLQRGDKAVFKETLRTAVLSALDAEGECRMMCDYDPWDVLLDAVRAAGVECHGVLDSARGILPQKHSLDVTPTLMRPKEGYGNWAAEIPVPPVQQ